jgi:peptidylprolyl isomerase
MKLFVALLSLFVATAAIAGDGEKKKKAKKPKLEKGMYAEFKTTKGNIIISLEYDKVPMTVANFVGLAEGDFIVDDTIEYKEPFYDGLKFHRVIDNFMIQGGDPQGNGSGGPEHRFHDEIVESLKHSGPGILSMANSGPNTNGSQFFITHKDTPWLDGKHTVFGHVIHGQDVVNAIVKDDIMEEVKIIRKGKIAKKWDATEHFKVVRDSILEIEKAKQAEFEKIAAMSQEEYGNFMYEEVLKTDPSAKLSSSGLVYSIANPGDELKPEEGTTMTVHYRGTFRKDGKQFDASYDRGQPMTFKYKVQRMIPGFEEGLGMLGKGGKARLIIPYYAAYGAKGRPGAIPPYSDLVFDIEIVDLKAAEEHDHDGHDHDHDGHDHQH